ncbi:MAG: AsmA protein, partial [Bacteroidia bacterium]
LAHLDKVQVRITGATVETVKLSLNGSVDLSRQIAEMALQLDIGATRGEGTVRYASFESPQIDADLHMNLLDPALLVLAGPGSAEAAPAAADPAVAAGGTLPLDAIRGIDTRAALRIDEARMDAHIISNMVVKLRAAEGVINISTLKGTLHGGQLDASATFDGRLNTAKLKTTGGLTGLDIARAVAATQATTQVTGSATLQWQLDSRGKTTDELTKNMIGPIKLDTTEVVLKGTNVEHLLCQSVALANQEELTQSFAADTQFKTLGAQIQLADGRAQLSPLQAQLPRLGLTGKGDYNIATGDLKARFKARLSPELEELDPACNISKRLTDIDFPVDCKGNTGGNPADWCRVDAEQIIKDLVVNEGRKKIEEKAGSFLNKWLQK